MLRPGIMADSRGYWQGHGDPGRHPLIFRFSPEDVHFFDLIEISSMKSVRLAGLISRRREEPPPRHPLDVYLLVFKSCGPCAIKPRGRPHRSDWPPCIQLLNYRLSIRKGIVKQAFVKFTFS